MAKRRRQWRLGTTPWRTILVKLIVPQIANNFSAFYENLHFITVLFWALWIQSTPIQPVALQLILLWSREAHPVSGCRFLRSHRRIHWETSFQKPITSIPNFIMGEGRGWLQHVILAKRLQRVVGRKALQWLSRPSAYLLLSCGFQYTALWRWLPFYRVVPFHAFTCSGPAPAHRTHVPAAPSCQSCFRPAPIHTTERVLLGLRYH
jgi:hypothetical protein